MPGFGLDKIEHDAYEYFHSNIRKFPTKKDGSIDLGKAVLQNNDVDAFRHAYASGIFTQRYGERTARILGWLNEFINFCQPAAEENMDFWNNNVGIKYGKKCKSPEKLLELLKEALAHGELIIDPADKRKSKDYQETKPSEEKPVAVLKHSPTGRNELFCDVFKGEVMTRAQFVKKIENGKYPGYRISMIQGIKTPVSKPDGTRGNNLG
jgi:hypothetical protein